MNELSSPTPQSGWTTVVNGNVAALSDGVGLYAENYQTTTGLVWGYFGGPISDSVDVSDGVTTSLASADTVYAVMHRATGVLTHATTTTNWDNTVTYGRVRLFVTGASTITSSIDWRFLSGGIFDRSGVATVDADDVTYTPTTLADWDGAADPGNVDDALDQLAERVADVEGAGGGGVANGAYTADAQAWQSKKYLMRDGQWRDPLVLGTGILSVGSIATVTDDTKYNSWPQACRLRDGRIMIAYAKGDSHNLDNLGRSVGRIATENLDGTLTWGSEFEIYDHASLVSVPYGLAQISTGRIFASIQQYAYTGSNYSAIIVYSDDDGATWSSPIDLTAASGLTVGALCTGPVVELRDGSLRQLVEGTDTGSIVNRYSRVLTSTDGGATWGGVVTVRDFTGSVPSYESAMALLDDDSLLVIHRTSQTASTHRAQRSTDGGATWGSPFNVFDGWGAPRFIQASNGTLIAVTRRNSGAAGIAFTSLDRGATWDAGTTFDATMYEFEYGCPVEMRDGRVLVVYGVQPTGSTSDSNIKVVPLTETQISVQAIPQVSKSAAYTIRATDANKHLLHPAADTNARTFTIDSNANVPHPIGTALTFVNETSQVLSIAITSDTLTLANSTTTGTRSLAQNGVATALKVATTKWIISGAGLT
jgi:hypothetical protein